MKIGIDVDGVIRNFMDKLIEVHLRENPGHKLIRKDIYDLSKWFPMGKNIYEFAFETHAEEIYLNSRLYPGAQGFLKEIVKKNELTFVTKQPNKMLEELTLEWINKKELPYHSIIFTKDKSVFKGDYILDDYAGNLQRVLDIGNSIPVCFDRPWNQDWNGPRVKTYNKFLKIIE